MKQIAILGSTGSIGCSTLDVIRHNQDKYAVTLLVGGQNSQKMIEQCIEFKPQYVVMSDLTASNTVKEALNQLTLSIEVLHGEQAICDLVQLPEIDYVMAAIVGAAGLKPTMAAIQKGKRILLANKESLVTCGSIFMNAVKQYQAELLPVDSEHNAIYQSLPLSIQQNLGFASLSEHGIHKIILTGSGGPFRETEIERLKHVTVSEAINHPNWSMGPKISVDSATMMNKGLEYIEARWLFNASKDEMEIIIHPQSIIHSMVRYLDGSIIAELGAPNMCTPIAYSMSYPERINNGVEHLDFTKISHLSFIEPDFNRYPCLKLAIEASESGQAATTVLNAANEIAVSAFLDQRIPFLGIPDLVERILQINIHSEPSTIEEVEMIDQWARQEANRYLNSKH